MADARLRVGVIIGSTRRGRFGPTIAVWIAGRIDGRSDMTADVIDLAGVKDDDYADVSGQLDTADAFVVVTPEYNHSFPAPLKAAIDAHGTEWHRKPIAFVCYGATSGGLRAVEHLRVVFAELHAMTVRDTVSFQFAPNRFDEDGQLLDPHGSNHAATRMLDELLWWGLVLREARTAQVAATKE